MIGRLCTTPFGALRPQLPRLFAEAAVISPQWRLLTRDHHQPPAPPAEFIDSPLYLGLRDETYPEVRDTFIRLFSGDYQEAAISWGIGSGKSFLSALAISYMLHRALCLRDPQAHYGLAPGSKIAFLNMGLNAVQARKVVFEEIRNKVLRSPWFRKNAPCEALATELRFPRGILVIPGNSAETYPLGFNVLGAVLDEASWYMESESGLRDTAEEIYNSLQRRIRSRFLDRGLLVMISSPRYEDDFLQRKLQEAKHNRRIFADQRPVWEIKPPGFYCGRRFVYQGLEIPIEYEADFERNPERAMRDLAARPSSTLTAYFTDPQALEACAEEREAAVNRHGQLEEWLQAPDNLPRFLHVDLGLKRDACGIAMCHVRDRDGEPSLFVDHLERITAARGGEIDFAKVRRRIYELRERGFNIVQVSYDGWQSVDSRQILARRGFKVNVVSVDRDLACYETLKELVQAGRIRWPRNEVLLRELKRLELIKGRKVDHPPGGSKDLADALAAATHEALRHGGGRVRGRVV
ncbi:MAG: hypothetical protein ACE5R4_17405 [Armatimonadota bacterium]